MKQFAILCRIIEETNDLNAIDAWHDSMVELYHDNADIITVVNTMTKLAHEKVQAKDHLFRRSFSSLMIDYIDDSDKRREFDSEFYCVFNRLVKGS
jgi:hypothetical protein